MKNKRFLGQHFLISKIIKEKICDIVNEYLHLCNSLLEIGSGDGAITESLLKFNKPLFAIEKDPNLVKILKEKYRNLILFKEDARTFNLDQIDKKFFPIQVVGNLPYYAATEIILNILFHPSKISSSHFTVQKEVAKKFSSKTNEEYYSKYSVWTAVFYETKKEFDIKSGAFSPPPKVLSSFITFIPREEGILREKDAAKFFNFVENIFIHQRKKVLSIFSQILNVENLENFLNFEKNSRAKELSPETYFQIFQKLSTI